MSYREERLDDPVQALITSQQGHQSTIWTAIPAKVVAVDKLVSQGTVHVQPTIMGMYRGPRDQTLTPYKMPVLLDCPVHFPGGGGFVLTYPLVAGDEGLIIVSSRCIDQWWATGADDNVQAEMRMHDLSDGFFLPGFRSRPNTVPSLNTNCIELRNTVGDAYVLIDSSKNVVVSTPSTATVTANAAVVNANTTFNGNVTINGNLSVTGNIVAGATIEGAVVHGLSAVNVGTSPTRSLGAHVHTGGTLTGGFTGTNQ